MITIQLIDVNIWLESTFRILDYNGINFFQLTVYIFHTYR